jgi:hypothetical protein
MLMRIEINIDDHTSKHMSPQAVDELKGSVLKYAENVVEEAGRFATRTSSVPNDPEITGTHVKDADIVLRHGYASKRKSKFFYVPPLLTLVGSLVAGLLADKDILKETIWMILFVIVIIITVVSIVWTLFKD